VIAPSPIERASLTGVDTPRLIVRVLGPLAIQDTSRTLGPRDLGGARPKQVLEILLSARGHSVPVDRLIELLWAGDPPENANGSLQTFVSVLRRHLAGDRELARQLVVTEVEAYRFATDRILFDLDRFDELLEASARQPTRSARASIESALDLVRGEAFEDEPYAGWAADLRGSYQGRILGARLDAADLALAEGDHAAALAHDEAAIALDRYSERAHRGQMLALYAIGRGHEALNRYRLYRSRLGDELGLEPTADTRALETAILRQVDVATLLPRRITHRGGGDPAAPALLGRRAELDTLSQAVAQALHGGVALIQVRGGRGLGKTRLLDELERDLDVRVGRAAASELEAHLPYVPLATAVRDALGDGALDGAGVPALGRVFPELALAARKADVREVEVLEALVALVARHGPVILMIDDLQWADRQTVAALAYLRRRGRGVGCAIVTAVGDVRSDHPVQRLPADVTVRLQPLSPGDLEPLGLPQLHEWTGGVPSLVVREFEAGRRPYPSASLVDALLADCRAQGEQAFRTLVAASLFEHSFDPEPLADLLDTEVTALTEELEHLCEQRILRIDGSRFRFRQEVCRRVLLASMSPARQRLLQERL
jgi:DNA-binding SARP family transcriptional activator